MSTNDPDQIRREIDQTRANLSYDVNALADEADPRNIARRQVAGVQEGVRRTTSRLKDRLFGSDDDLYYEDGYGGFAPYGGPQAPQGYQTDPSLGDRAGQARDQIAGAAEQAKDSVANAAGTARDAVADAPRQVRRQTQGAPLALGMIAFGLGAVTAALLPSSSQERRWAGQVKDQAQPYVQEAKAMAQEAVDNVRPQAEQAVADVQASAQAGVENVKSEAQAGVDHVKSDAQDGAQRVKSEAQAGADHVKSDAQQEKDNVAGTAEDARNALND